ncbi:DUF4254 domain-containing protein [Massilia arenosa]|uniref:DUF4254 domain-containing protein n=1 Tax=Zemynaea arenosa TaxID=2561931 RepID=A0A4Y9S837_9BURK|nr:DUF4254 domain-containing protein [Massilia arenosa]TFW17723.1 DUF4254 domain-containing protein [Massilia arenosa]
MLADLTAASVIRLHDRVLDPPPSGAPPAPADTAWHAIATNHRCNCLLWDEEDRARRRDVPPATIAQSKRLIDQYNQQRNDAVEAMDEAVLARLVRVQPQPGARLSSETAGAMIDRLSILALKIFHMRAQSLRTDASRAHVEACRFKLTRLLTQRADLAFCLDQLLAEAADGRAYFKVYRQFKMYNDPALTPYLYGPPDRAAGAAP